LRPLRERHMRRIGDERVGRNEGANLRVIVSSAVVHQPRAIELLAGELMVGRQTTRTPCASVCVVALVGVNGATAVGGQHRAAQVVTV